MPTAPVKLIFNVPVAPFVKVPTPASEVVTVSVPLFWYVPLIDTVGIEIAFAPLKVFVLPVNVCVPVLAVKVPSFCKLLAKEKVPAAVSFQVPPLLIVTLPVWVCVPVVLLCVSVPLTEVVPVTVRVL